MTSSRQVPPGKLPASTPIDPPIDSAALALIEQSLVTMRRDQTRRRLQRRAAREDGALGDRENEHSHRRGRRGGFGGGPDGGHRGAHGNAAKFRLLDALAASGHSLSISDLGEAIGVDQPRASRLVASAAEEGLLRRTPDPRDARRSVIELTGAGRRIIEQAHGNRREAVAEALAGFTPAETEQFAGLLSRFVEAWPRDRS